MKYKISNNKIISKTDISGIIIKGLIDKNSINKERRIFSGFGSVAVIDRQGDYLPIHEFKPVMEKLMARGAPVTDSHSNHVVGKIVDYTYKPTETGELGLYLTAEIYNHYPSDEETWHKIQDGEYTGFSLGGKAGTKTPTCTNIGCYNILGDIEAWEFSIVERPANQLANIDKVNKLAKSSNVVNEVMYSIMKERVYIKTPAEAPKNTQVYTGERGGKYYETEEIPKSNKVSTQTTTPQILSTQSLVNELTNKAKKKFSVVDSYMPRAGFILNDGSVIALHDHNDINELVPEINADISPGAIITSRTFMQKAKALRIHFTNHGGIVYVDIDINNMPTEKQLQAFKSNKYNVHEIIYDFYDKDKLLDSGKFDYSENTVIDKFKTILQEISNKNLKTNINKVNKLKYGNTNYAVKDGHIIQKPFANYKDFAQCVAENKDKGDPNAYCGYIKHKVEKSKIYVHNESDIPKGAKIQTGKYGGRYYESESQMGTLALKQKTIESQINNILQDYDKFSSNKMNDEDKIMFANKLLNIYRKTKKDVPKEQFNNTIKLLESDNIKDKAIGIDNAMGLTHYNNLFLIDAISENIPFHHLSDEELYEEEIATKQLRTKILDKLNEIRNRRGLVPTTLRKTSNFILEDAKRIGDELNIDWTKIDQNEFLIGLNIELEHGTISPETNVTDDDEIATAKIVLAHLNEFPDYYSKEVGLPKLEDELKKYFITKEKVYVKSPSDVPKGVKISEGERGGLYYESEGISSTSQNKLPKENYNLNEKIIPFIDKLKQYSEEYLNDGNLKLSEDAKNISQNLENNNFDKAMNIFQNSDLKYDIGNTYQALNKIKDEKYIAENFGLDWGTKPGIYEVWRSGDLTETRGIFTSIDEVGAKAYGPNVKKYKVNVKNPLVAGDLREAYEKLTGKKIGIISGNEQWKNIDKKVSEMAKKRGYDVITYIAPAPPARRELVILNSNSIINE